MLICKQRILAIQTAEQQMGLIYIKKIIMEKLGFDHMIEGYTIYMDKSGEILAEQTAVILILYFLVCALALSKIC